MFTIEHYTKAGLFAACTAKETDDEEAYEREHCNKHQGNDASPLRADVSNVELTGVAHVGAGENLVQYNGADNHDYDHADQEGYDTHERGDCTPVIPELLDSVEH